MKNKDTIEKRYFDKLANKLEEGFEKGERCTCGVRLEARSKALVLNGYANLYLKEALDEQKMKLEDVHPLYEMPVADCTCKRDDCDVCKLNKGIYESR